MNVLAYITWIGINSSLHNCWQLSMVSFLLIISVVENTRKWQWEYLSIRCSSFSARNVPLEHDLWNGIGVQTWETGFRKIMRDHNCYWWARTTKCFCGVGIITIESDQLGSTIVQVSFEIQINAMAVTMCNTRGGNLSDQGMDKHISYHCSCWLANCKRIQYGRIQFISQRISGRAISPNECKSDTSITRSTGRWCIQLSRRGCRSGFDILLQTGRIRFKRR